MKIKTTKETYKLTGQSIDIISKDIKDVLQKLNLEKRNMLGILLSMEEVMLKWMDELGDNADVVYSVGTRLGKPNISLSVKGSEINPFKDEDDWSNNVLANLGLSPNYTYKNGQNIVNLTLSKPQKNPIMIFVGAVVISIALGILGLLIPNDIRLSLVEQILNPVYNAFLGMLKAIAIPMVFLGISYGIVSMGDASIFGKIGKKMITRFLGISFLITAVSGGLLCILFKLNYANAGADISQFSTVFQMLLDFLPNGLFTPFVEANALQVIVIAIVIGLALLVLGEKGKYVAKNLEELNSVGIFADELLAKIIPLFVSIIVIQNIWTGDYKEFARAWKPILVYILLIAIFLGISIANVCIKFKVSPVKIIKKLFPTFIIAVTTASTSACFGEYAATLPKDLGVDSKLSTFGSVLGLAFFSPTTAISYLICAYYVAETSGIACSISWIIVAIFISFILSIATPTIPGGAIPMYSVLFLQLGLPNTALAVIITLDVIFDFIATATDKSFIQLELVNQAKSNDLLNIKTLRK